MILIDTERAIGDFLRACQLDVYPEPPSQIHSELIPRMMDWALERFKILSGTVLDIGCGQGQALEEFKKRGFDPLGITIGLEDYQACLDNGLACLKMDMHNIGSALLWDHYDIVWARHSLEHSPIPLFVLKMIREEILKPDGFLYVEVPMPDTSSLHEGNRNHFSIFGKRMWMNLVERAGFKILDSCSIEFETVLGKDEYFGIAAQRVDPATPQAV